MATGDGTDEVRVLQNLRGKIYDAKHLVPNKMRDFFCTINLDQEEVFRTQVVEKSLSPYFGEEFYFEIPRTFQWLSFYIYDKSVLQKDLRIGKFWDAVYIFTESTRLEETSKIKSNRSPNLN